MRLELVVLAFALAPWSPQAPAGQDPAPQPFPLSDSAVASGLDVAITGAWQLQNIESTAIPLFPGDLIGYALFHDGYLSLEIHGVSQVGLDDSDGEFFQTGFHRYSFDGRGGMETYSMIGVSNLTEDEDVLFLPAGDRRKFKVTCLNERLTLERSDGLRLVFKKLGKLPFPGAVDQVDAFGRPVKPATDVVAPPGGKQQ
ncbi:MAG: hypothetical protein HZA52_07220 [Planctomycetes bacterium]|nr:hypothetical protein [Planctomycetota bacterium]